MHSAAREKADRFSQPKRHASKSCWRRRRRPKGLASNFIALAAPDLEQLSAHLGQGSIGVDALSSFSGGVLRLLRRV